MNFNKALILNALWDGKIIGRSGALMKKETRWKYPTANDTRCVVMALFQRLLRNWFKRYCCKNKMWISLLTRVFN